MNTTANRTDIHRAAEIVPADYIYVGVFYQGDDRAFAMSYRAENLRHAQFVQTAADRDQQVFVGNHDIKGTCDICGAHFGHGAYFLHQPTGDIIHTGQDCADKLDMAAGSSLASERGAINSARSRNAKRVAREDARQAFLDANPGLAEALELDNSFVADCKGKFLRYDNLSPRQVETVIRIAAEANKPKPKTEVIPSPVVEGNGITITGRIVSTKIDEGGLYGDVLKMLVEDDRGFRVYGTVPACLGQPERDQRVTFVANTERSRKDQSFGFFKRPRCAEIEEG